MYFKLVSNDTGWGGSWAYGNYGNRRYLFMKDVMNVINGSFTSVSQLNATEAVFNTSASVITGSAPSNNMYIQRFKHTVWTLCRMCSKLRRLKWQQNS